MNDICFRCSISQKELKEENYLFFDAHFLNDYRNDGEKISGNNNNIFLDNNKEIFLQYLRNKEETANNDIEKVYKNFYMNIYLCKICNGLHNIDLILFYNKNSIFHYNFIEKNLLINLEDKKKISEAFKNVKKIFDILVNNIDIIFFFLHLQEAKIINRTENITLEVFKEYFEHIKEKIIIHVNLENNFIKKNIHRVFSFVLIYFYLNFYIKIYDSLNMCDRKSKFLVNLYKHSILVFSAHINKRDISDNNEEKGTVNQTKRKKKEFYKKKKKLKNENENELINSNSENENFYNIKKIEEIESDEKKTDNMNLLKGEENSKLITKNHIFLNIIDIYISFNNLCICGYYNKYNKEISQTKWLVNNLSKSVLSIEECLYKIFKNVFSYSTCKFIGSGREDKDARMMSIGRPFVFVLKETKFSFLNFYLFFSKLKKLGYSYNNNCEIKTLEELNDFLKNNHFSNLNSLNNNICYKEKYDLEKKEKFPEGINDSYALINKENTISLYDIMSNKTVIEQSKDKIFEEKKIGNFHISCSYNKEMEVLLSKNVKLNREDFDTNRNYINSDIKDNNKYSESDCLNINETTINIKDNYNMNKKNVSYNINDFVEVKLSNVAFSTNYGLIKKIMKYGEERKKAYKCLIYHSSSMTKEKIQKINKDVLNYEKNSSYVIKVNQKTPIRVLHRRGLIKRERKIYKFNLIYIHEHFSLLCLLAQSGMYIKEFVNGDRGRTFPNLKYFFGGYTFVNILNLDVSNLIYD
ncbi:conserved Plasmodium protein, unknown function [Plasmodium relictum]|uniref:tRNA pseudouridine(55) synthase n=1 Tax=Plasmodium relictum TaxID=85471 RepID=A0A1J1HI42_PLARL|nr:conserved Plasmodium protein, unknown function [Plasmodium relictum]CRH04114.1 conserved Plasmodium protein, unknown function [Plasmodium relictum]